jgi:hypothetical protein
VKLLLAHALVYALRQLCVRDGERRHRGVGVGVSVRGVCAAEMLRSACAAECVGDGLAVLTDELHE